MGITDTKTRYLTDRLNFYKKLKTNQYTNDLINEMESNTEMLMISNLFTNQINELIMDIPKSKLKTASASLDIGFKPIVGRSSEKMSNK